MLPTSSCSILLHPLSLWVFYLIPDIWARSRTAPARYGSERRFVYDSLRHVGDRRFPRKGGEHREDCRTSYLRANLKCPAKCSASELPLEIQLPRHHTQAFSQSLIIGAAAKEILRSLLEASQYKVYPFGYRKFTLIPQNAHLGQPPPRLQCGRTSSLHAGLCCVFRKRSETCGSKISQKVRA